MYCHLSAINVILQIRFLLMLLYDQFQVQWDVGAKKDGIDKHCNKGTTINY